MQPMPDAAGPTGASGSTGDSGLTEEEAAARLAETGPPAKDRSSRSYTSIVRANVFTVFNLIIGAFGVLTLVFGDIQDALFLGVIVANSAIGIYQEVKAKQKLDQLALLVAPHAKVRRSGTVREVAVEDVVVGDLVLVAAGDQVVADGTVAEATSLSLDESVLTGESEPVRLGPGDEMRSGAFVVEGTGAYAVTAVGEDCFAARITGQARSFRHSRSPLQLAIDRLLFATVGLVVGLGSLLVFALHHRSTPMHQAVATATAGVTALVPEGLVVLVNLTYAAAAIRMGRKGVLAQQLNAIESLASVDTICIDKTGTLTESTLRVVEVVPADGHDPRALEESLRTLVATASSHNTTMTAIAQAYPAEPRQPLAEIPFSSARRWSAVQTDAGSLFIGAPGRIPLGDLAEAAERNQNAGRRVLAVASTPTPLPAEVDELPPPRLEPLGLIILAEQLRPNVSDTVKFLADQDIRIIVLSGDDPRTVTAIASDVGIPSGRVAEGREIPAEPAALEQFAQDVAIIGRISPDGKQQIVQALRDQGRYVAMVGDGVNDVPALKLAHLSIAQGSGTQMARAVSDLVLIDGDFGSVPKLVAEGRRALRNLQRVAKLYVTRSALAAFLIMTIGLTTEAYPLLPRHLTLAGTLTVGIPTFFLALAPSTGPWSPDGFARGVARWAVPAGFIVGTGTVASYLFALHDLDIGLRESRTVALTTLIACGLYLVMALESGGSRQRSTLVAIACGVMAVAYVVVLALPFARDFFDIVTPTLAMAATAVAASAAAILALWLSGFTLSTAPPDA